MLTDQKFWFGFVAGIVIYWVYKNYMGKKLGGG
jgi:hypothetical protein